MVIFATEEHLPLGQYQIILLYKRRVCEQLAHNHSVKGNGQQSNMQPHNQKPHIQSLHHSATENSRSLNNDKLD